MLALTHHLIVQHSYHLAYPLKRVDYWFEGYELLGDDIVLFDPQVAHHYLVVMKLLGVEINQAKSVVANRPAFEFAKITGFRGVDVSPISWKM